MSNKKVLEIRNLSVSFKVGSHEIQAVRNISLDLYKGETLAIVGESGSGKSVTLKSIMRLLSKKNSTIKGGSILFNGLNLLDISEKEMQKIRGKDISMIVQDPMASLNPTAKISKQLEEPLIKHQELTKKEAIKRSIELLEMVGIPNASQRLKQYPHHFSGGMRQRVVIASSIACNPQILLADEPTTALDVTIQAQILDLLKTLQKTIDTSIIFVTHDLGVVANIANRVAVMYAGKIVEFGTVNEIFYNPKHPYTWGLLCSMPTLNMTNKELYAIPGSPPDLMAPPKGDAFARRSPYALNIDLEEEPPFFKVSDTHYAATWLLHPKAPRVEPPEEIMRRWKIFTSLRDNEGES